MLCLCVCRMCVCWGLRWSHNPLWSVRRDMQAVKHKLRGWNHQETTAFPFSVFHPPYIHFAPLLVLYPIIPSPVINNNGSFDYITTLVSNTGKCILKSWSMTILNMNLYPNPHSVLNVLACSSADWTTDSALLSGWLKNTAGQKPGFLPLSSCMNSAEHPIFDRP